jgi:hypothetical protein
LSAFRTSHDVVKSPNARLMIARCLRELGRLGEAYAEASAAAAEAEAVSQRHPRYLETAQAARDDLAALKSRVGFVKLDGGKVPAGATVKIGERSFDVSALKEAIAVTPGTTTIIVSAPGEKELRKNVVVQPGTEQTVTLDSEPAQSLDSGAGSDDAKLAEEPAKPVVKTVELGPDTSMRTWAYVAGGVGAVGLATFGVFGLINNSSYDELDGDCPNGACPPGRSDDIDAGRRYQLIANVGLGVGILGLGAGATLFVLSANRSPAEDARQTAVRVSPGAVSLEGRF